LRKIKRGGKKKPKQRRGNSQGLERQSCPDLHSRESSGLRTKVIRGKMS